MISQENENMNRSKELAELLKMEFDNPEEKRIQVKALLNAGVDLSYKDGNTQHSLLHLACDGDSMFEKIQPDLEIIEMLI